MVRELKGSGNSRYLTGTLHSIVFMGNRYFISEL